MTETITPQMILDYLFSPQTQTSEPLSATRVIIAMTITFLLIQIVIFVYRSVHHQPFAANTSRWYLNLVGLVTTMIIMPITTNIILSLGMVGALSIVRFRTAVKAPIDIAFLFWVISIGIANGAGFYQVSIIGTLTISVFMFLSKGLNFLKTDPYILIVRYTPQTAGAVKQLLPKHARVLTMMSMEEKIELTVELSSKDFSDGLPTELMALEGVSEASMVFYNGEYVPS